MSLPEKEFFSLDEIISRWRFATCDRATLLDYARRDLLIYSVYLRNIGSHRRVREDLGGVVTTTSTVEFQFTSSDYKWQPIRYLKSDDARRILEAHPSEKIAVSILYSSPLRNKKSGTGYLQAHYFTTEDLFVTRAERDRFEAVHKVNLASGHITKAWRWLSEPANQKTLGIIGSVIAAIAVAVAWGIQRMGIL